MWIDRPEDEENLNQPTDTGEGPSVGAGAGGGASIQSSTTAAVGTPSSMSPTPEAPGQKFGTIQDYFKGSKAQGEKLGQDFTGKLDATKQQQQSAIGQAAAGAEGQVAANTIGFNQDLVSKAASDPTKIANDSDQYDQFMQQWNASYKGPQGFEETEQYGDAAKAAKAAQDKATQASSTGGRQQILQDEFNVYGAGNKGLDESLIQQSSSFGTVGEKAKELNSLQDYLKAKSGDVASKAQEAKATTAQTKQKAQDALLGEQGAVKQFKSDIDTRTAQEQAKASTSIQDLQKAVEAKADLSDEQLKMLGTTRQEYKDLIQKPGAIVNSQNLQAYLTAQNPAAKISRETVAGQQDIAKDQALSKLTGGSKLLGAAQQQGKLVDFDKDKALQDYLDSINADQAARDAAKREREEAQAAEVARRDEERTAKREDTQNQIVGGIAAPGLNLIAPGVAGAIGGKISEIIDKDKTASKIVGAVDKNVTQPVVNTVKTVAKAVKSIFCFDGETMIDMADGSKTAIKDIKLGDVIKGGTVISTRQALTPNGTRYEYKGIIVTGAHAVKEKRWIRVRDSVHAHRIDGGGVVYSLVTNTHKMYIKDILFADEHETNDYETLSLDESLRYLNHVVLAVC